MVAMYAIRSDYAELGHLEEFQSHKCWVKLLSFVHAVGDLNCSIIEPSFFQPEVMTIVTDPLWFSSLNSHKKRAAKLTPHTKPSSPTKQQLNHYQPWTLISNALPVGRECPTSWKGQKTSSIPPPPKKKHLHAPRRWWSSWRTWQGLSVFFDLSFC